ncbi:cystathionine gamma-synthase family protein [Glaciecola sp. MH2013]|uniref:cystathionine gamma-synthase family protein n=1 Tax=Glaciecola sp. MH2013 TaxID=2785524 RepID=UPI00189C614E|nr:cystathionine gamma-synthase family protein [Glaciecola sp. MH2013]MBF7072763.1 cystathionine gamma-synthase family protein [Glaciecola sp. MH2013]
MKNLSPETRLVHADRLLNRPQSGGVHEATNNSVLFEFEDVQGLVDVFQGKKAGHVYSRSSSSSAVSLQNILNDFDKGVGAVVFATGMAAISATFYSLLKAGDHIVVSQFLFGNTRSFMSSLENFGIEVTLVDVTEARNVEDAIKANTKMVFCESIANPVTQVSDLVGIGELCQSKNILFALDNTMTPHTLLDAKKVNASLLLTSLTKYIGGHGNVLGGVVVDTGLYDWAGFSNIDDKYRVTDISQWGLTQIKKRGLRDMGATLAPQSAHQISIGLETLSMRMSRTCANAMALAKYLSTHKGVDNVFYPGLLEHPQHERAKALFNRGYGGILSVELDASIDVHQFLNQLKLIISATHLGDTRTLALPVASTIFYENGAEQRKKMGIRDSLIRISVGIEDIEDILADFDQAFETLIK